ncbi:MULTISPECIES: 3-isopropylmalate dehydrogenase [Mammaliicoccus]|uniref:3-isopropylmalate dehydrogenase n=1 Tax=Mammaliicoccus fleurettii TaxID=150056 RepID=A0ABS5MP14_9STAP|nr:MULTISPECIES: 3-isopropylmalate dehydrogenase [Mammaliicoccus]HCN60164.1 3-isopropylmalate dehydrogenase [Staphylococcus sp.]MBL0847520.1 3-isopropylmalate dehydrogenase [Mammaliicoccus fleurettii]MBO3061963.1 3-isopropylmalate dehydrogenase [Mammaliicoccus fleurettii]MBS3672507.1 3-isopropylmalate dehydrogenase [Mammaliicoccus fleurettii]MBS3697376.1 3-isopropylmalate dehydrogenase [Mammaliicoccus fleurettii]
MTYKITALPGDGIGPEILEGSIEILEALAKKFEFEYDLVTKDFGGIAIDKHGEPLPPETLEACQNSDAILLGAVGGPKWTNPKNRPEHGLLGIRKSLKLFANIRPTIVTEATAHLSPLKESLVKDTDFIIVRELTGGLYFGEPKYFNENQAVDTLTYTTEEITRIAHIAFKLALKRKNVVTSVDKENVLSSSKLWRQTLEQVSKEYPDVTLNHLLVDACSMHLITNPKQFDVIVTENLFGDILSDEASVIPGSLGLSPSASFGESGPSLYEPIHGSAPDIAGQNKANPSGMLLSLAMCIRESLHQPECAQHLENIVFNTINEGIATKDLGGSYSTSEVFEAIKKSI